MSETEEQPEFPFVVKSNEKEHISIELRKDVMGIPDICNLCGYDRVHIAHLKFPGVTTYTCPNPECDNCGDL